MQTMFDAHAKWQNSLLPKPDKNAPDATWERANWHIRHTDKNERPKGFRRMGEKPRGFAYQVLVHIPPKPKGDATEQIKKAAGGASSHECDGGRWITVHPNGENEPGQPVYLCPNADGSHTIVGGAGGKLNGHRITGVKSEEEYKHAAREKREERQRQDKLAKEIRQHAIGRAAFAKEQQDKAATATESRANRHQAERAAIAAVFAVQGIDPAHMDLPKEKLAGVDAKTADTLRTRHHNKLYAYAKQVAANTRDLVSAGIDGVTEAATGDLGVGDLARAVTGGKGIGYASPVSALAAEYGLTDEKRNEVAEGVKLRSLLDRSDLNLEEAAGRRQSAKERGQARSLAEGRVRDAVGDLEKEGVGPSAVAQFSKAPAIETMGQAVDVLTAMKNAEAARAAHKQTMSALDSVGELSTLPKAAVVVAKPLTDDEAKAAIAGDLDEMARRKAMVGLVGASNAVEAEHGSLREALSLGHNLAFNTIASAVDGSNVDPLVHDILGASGAARILAARWRAALPPEEFAKLKDTLAAQHVKTQNAIANDAVAEADGYLGQVEQMQANAPIPNTPEGIEAALVEHEKRTSLVEQAQKALGLARGRVEAAAALNDALMHSSDGPVQVALGAMSPEQALTSAAALGLDNPTEHDPHSGKVTKEGDFDIHNDGHNAILTLSPGAVQRMGGTVDAALMARQERSAAIKRGDFDEADWVPAGLTRRPTSEYEVNPLEVQRPDITLGLLERPADASTDGAAPLGQAEIQDKLRSYVGALLDAGRDPAHIDALLRSEEFVGGLGVSVKTASAFQAALQELSPPWNPTPGASANPEKARAEIERYKAWQADREKRFDGCLQEHLARQKEAGNIDTATETLSRQRLPLDATVQDCAYVAATSDPRLRFAFSKYGDLDPDARASVRRFAYEHLFGLDPKKDGDDLLTPLSAEQHQAWQEWGKLSDTAGDPYRAIQGHWAEVSQEEDLFGDKNPPHPLSTVDMSDDTALVQVAQKVPGLLGYSPTVVKGPDGQPTQKVVELEASAERPASVIAQDVRARARKVLRTHFLGEMLGMQDLASQGWSPASVRTASDRWGEYASSMGGDKYAYQTVQEFMQGHIAEGFAREYAKRTGTALAIGNTNVKRSDRHAEAMLPPDVREALQGKDASERAKFIQRQGGKFALTDGGVRSQAELAKQSGQERAALFGGGEASGDATARNVSVSRKTIGSAAEATLAGILPHLDTNHAVQAASGLNFSGDKAPIQRAIRLIEANKRQGVNLGTGMGKAVTAIGAFTHLRSQGDLGENGRGLFVVPSKPAHQMPSEIDKFRDPSVPLTKYCGAGASPDERRAAMADPNIHVVITTPEGLREDITHAVAKNEGITPEEATARIMSPDSKESDRFDLIHRAMDAAGYNFDFNLMDEAHRLLSRAGKPDAHMQRVADAVGAKSPYYVYSTADAIKNDVSEAWDVLHKIEPTRYPEGSRDGFLRKYGRDTVASGLALQREMEPYLYPERADFGVTTDHVLPSEGQMQLTPEQQTAHDAVLDAYKKARRAKMQGRMDLASLKVLAPKSFEGVTGTEDMARVGEGVSKALGAMRDAALNQIVNTMPGGAKENFVSDYANTHRDENGKVEPLIVCTDLLSSVSNIAARLKKEGHRVVTLTGEGGTNASTKAQMAFQPPQGGEPTADILVMSNAGAAGLNLQRGKHLIHVDVPQTAMIDQQRNGRIRRFGQMSNTVHVRDLVTASPFDQRARKTLTEKGKLRELMTSPSASIDDSGLAQAIEESGVRNVLAKARTKNA